MHWRILEVLGVATGLCCAWIWAGYSDVETISIKERISEFFHLGSALVAIWGTFRVIILSRRVTSESEIEIVETLSDSSNANQWKKAYKELRDKAIKVDRAKNKQIGGHKARRELVNLAVWAAVTTAAGSAAAALHFPVDNHTRWIHPTALVAMTSIITCLIGVAAAWRFSRKSNSSTILWTIGFLPVFVSNLCGVLVSLPYHGENVEAPVKIQGVTIPLGLLIVLIRLVVLPIAGYFGAMIGLSLGRYLRRWFT